MKSLFIHGNTDVSKEIFETMVEKNNFKLERIITNCQKTPEGEWLSQERAEFVVVLKGRATLIFKSDGKIQDMYAGDYVLIEPNELHRVDSVSAEETVWLALHYDK